MSFNIFGLEKEKLHWEKGQKVMEISQEHLLKIDFSGNCRKKKTTRFKIYKQALINDALTET